MSELFSEWVVEAAERVHHLRRACDVQASDVLRGVFSGPWTGVMRDETVSYKQLTLPTNKDV